MDANRNLRWLRLQASQCGREAVRGIEHRRRFADSARGIRASRASRDD